MWFEKHFHSNRAPHTRRRRAHTHTHNQSNNRAARPSSTRELLDSEFLCCVLYVHAAVHNAHIIACACVCAPPRRRELAPFVACCLRESRRARPRTHALCMCCCNRVNNNCVSERVACVCVCAARPLHTNDTRAHAISTFITHTHERRAQTALALSVCFIHEHVRDQRSYEHYVRADGRARSGAWCGSVHRARRLCDTPHTNTVARTRARSETGHILARGVCALNIIICMPAARNDNDYDDDDDGKPRVAPPHTRTEKL